MGWIRAAAEYSVERYDTLEVDWRCDRCGFESRVHALGGGSTRANAFSGAEGHYSAVADAAASAKKDAGLMLALARCPSCRYVGADGRKKLGLYAGVSAALAVAVFEGGDLLVGGPTGLGLGVAAVAAAIAFAGVWFSQQRRAAKYVLFLDDPPAS